VRGDLSAANTQANRFKLR